MCSLQEAQLVLASPHLAFKIRNKGQKQFTLLMSSDYERNEWRESIEGLKSKCKFEAQRPEQCKSESQTHIAQNVRMFFVELETKTRRDERGNRRTKQRQSDVETNKCKTVRGYTRAVFIHSASNAKPAPGRPAEPDQLAQADEAHGHQLHDRGGR